MLANKFTVLEEIKEIPSSETKEELLNRGKKAYIESTKIRKDSRRVKLRVALDEAEIVKTLKVDGTNYDST